VDELRFDGRVVIVTGGGRGVGRSHALLLASRGAQVVVADYGDSLAGAGASSEPADDVVREIAAAGGNAVACFASVAEEAGAASIVDAALTNFGRIDAVINNAGISDKHPFDKLTVDQCHRMMDVHMFGTLYVTRAAWPHFVKAGYGRVVNTTSEGMLGTLEQLTSYGAAKGAVLGLTRTLAAEGVAHGIRVNAVAPRARTRMAEEGKGAYEPGSAVARRYDEVMASLDPELVSPTAAYLAHESCRLNGEALVSGGGNVRRMAIVLSEGISKPALTVEDVAENLDTILDITDPEVPAIGGFGS
jgi:NAD(P)-dependent dehydrogenase (short-subunit alcohol dehydrogenase family)